MTCRRRTWAALLALSLGTALWAWIAPEAGPARAAPVAKPSSALVLAPEDSAFFSTSLRNREQFERLIKSKAFAKLRDLPAVKTGWQLFLNEYNNPFGELAEFRAFVEAKENQELIALLQDAASQEMFFYGGKGWADFLKLYLELNQAQSFAPLQAQLAGENPAQAQGRAILQALAKNKDRLRVPDLVLGFRITDTKKAQSQIKRLEELLKMALSEAPPPIRNALKRVKIGDDSFLTLQLNGSMVPWEEIPFSDVETKPGEFDPLIKKLRSLTLTAALGVRGDYLLFSIGSSHIHLGTLGKGKVLADRPEFKPLAKAGGKPLTGISYVSKDFNAQMAEYNIQQLGSLTAIAQAGLAVSDLPAEKQKAITDDLKTFVAELRKNIPEPGATMSFSFMTERGYESYSYNHGSHPTVDSSRPLTLLDHVGGNPILAVVGRSKGDLEGYEFLVKWTKKAYGHVDDLLRSHLPPEEKEKYEKAAKVFVPLAKKFDEVTRTLFLPAFDRQFGLVIDAKWKSKQWQKDLALPAALPLPELGLVFGVKDAEKLKKAGQEYRVLFNQVMAEVRKLAPPGEIPPIEIPAPKTEETKVGTLYTYPVPKEAGLDKQVVPNAGLSASVAVMTLSKGHSVRLLTPTPLKVDSKPLADRKRKATAAMVFNFPALVDAAEPWIRLGVQMAEAELQHNAGEDLPAGFRNLDPQVSTVLKVLRCWRNSTSITYVEGGALVTHSETVFKDLDE